MSALPPPPKVSIERQIQCVRRELKKRESVYKRWVEQGKMTQEKADEEREAMAAVLWTLLAVEAKTLLI